MSCTCGPGSTTPTAASQTGIRRCPATRSLQVDAGSICRPTLRGVAYGRSNHRGDPMNITLAAGPLVSLIAGILILVVPRLLNYIVALYLIVIGLLGLFAANSSHIV